MNPAPPSLPHPPHEPQLSQAAKWSLILGLLGLVLCLPAIGALICGIVALANISGSKGTLRGTGMAITGLILSVTPIVEIPFLIGLSTALYSARNRQKISGLQTLSQARLGFKTTLTRQTTIGDTAPPPGDSTLELTSYRSPVGSLPAYISRFPRDEEKRPAIIWLTGGFSNSISENAWETSPPENDQSAMIFRQMGLVTFYPSLRGGNDQNSFQEGYFGEVDDVIAAWTHLSTLKGIDPERIYLGGHSTGGTLALLTAESSSCFRAVFALGPVSQMSDYGAKYLPYDQSNPMEDKLRSPIEWLHGITSHTWVFEGVEPTSNISSLRALRRANLNYLVRFKEMEGYDHFSVILPVSKAIATQILEDTGPRAKFEFMRLK